MKGLRSNVSMPEIYQQCGDCVKAIHIVHAAMYSVGRSLGLCLIILHKWYDSI